MAFGFGGALLFVGAGVSPFVLIINNVDVTEHLKANTMNIRIPLEGRGSADFVVSDHTGTFRPQIGQDVVFFAGTTRLFGGRIQETTETFTPGTNLYMEIKVQALTYTFLLDRKLVGKYYLASGLLSTWGAQVFDIVDSYLAADGVSFDPSTGPTDSFVGQQNIFDYVTATDAMDTIAQLIGATWQVDAFKVLRFYDLTNAPPAPLSLADNDHNWKEMQVLRVMTNYRNRQAVKPSKNILNLITESFSGQWQSPLPSTGVSPYLGSYFLSYNAPTLPFVQVNGVTQRVAPVNVSTLPFSGPYDFWWQYNALQRNQGYPPLTNADIIDVSYESPLPGVFWVNDTAEIAARQAAEGGTGIYEALDAPANVEDADTALTDGAGLLEKYGRMLLTINVKLPKRLPNDPAILPGQLLTINTTRPLVNGSYIIDTVDVKEVDKTFLEYTLGVGDHKMRIKGYKYFTKIKQGLSRPRDRITATAPFSLAASINGITNPGLVTWAYNALPPGLIPFKVVKYGTYAYVDVVFQTPPTTTDIILDIVNAVTGISIMKDPITYPVGTTGTVTALFFVTNPMYCNVGDTFVPIVTQADATAMDGLVNVVMFA